MIDLAFISIMCVLFGWILGMITGMVLLLSKQLDVVYEGEEE